MTNKEAAHIVDVAFGVPQAVRRVGEDRTYHEKEIRKAKDMAIKALEQPCDVPDINVGDIYECPCGYEWDKSKVVRHHFCPNCGRTVNSSYNSIKPELKSCEDAISRQAVLDAMYELCDTGETLKENPWRDNPHIDAVVDTIERLPSVNPRPQPKTGQWIEYDHGLDAKYYQCSICKGFDRGEKGRYCKWCGTKMVEPQESGDT